MVINWTKAYHQITQWHAWVHRVFGNVFLFFDPNQNVKIVKHLSRFSMIMIRLLLPALSAVIMTVAIATTSDVVGAKVKVNWVLCHSNSLSVFSYIYIYVSLYFETYFQSAGESGGLSSNSVSRGSPPLLLSSSSQRSLSHRTQWLTARPPDTNWPSVPPSRDKYWGETHSWGNTEIHGGEKDRRRKKRERAKRGGGCDMWQVGVPTAHRYLPFLFFLIVFQLDIAHRTILTIIFFYWANQIDCEIPVVKAQKAWLRFSFCMIIIAPGALCQIWKKMILNWLLGRVILGKDFPKEMGAYFTGLGWQLFERGHCRVSTKRRIWRWMNDCGKLMLWSAKECFGKKRR